MSPRPRPCQLLSPEKRLAHQPRLGVPLSSAAVLEMTGCGGGSVGGGLSLPRADSRTVERRRGASSREPLDAAGAAGGGGFPPARRGGGGGGGPPPEPGGGGVRGGPPAGR